MDYFHIIRNQNKDTDLKITNVIKRFLENNNRTCTFEGEIPDNTECIMVLGGDGTLLQVACETIDRNIPLIGVNLGRLGYLAEIEHTDIEEALLQLINNDFIIEERMMIEGNVYRKDNKIQNMYGLNDIVVTRDGDSQILSYHIYVNNQNLYHYYADGIIVATPTGSTGYSLSAGGPIVEPNANLMVITPICPHTIHSRSVILSDKDEVVIEIGIGKKHEKQYARVSFDGDNVTSLTTGDRVSIKKFNKKTKIIRLNQVSFLKVLHKKMSST